MENESKKETTKGETKEEETTVKETTPEETTSSHEHTWVPWLVFTEVEEQGHWETVLVEEEWTEEIYEYHTVCNGCGAFLDNEDPGEHQILYCKSSYTNKNKKVGEIYHEAIYDEIWIVDVPGGTRSEILGVRCKDCGETVEK
ncbi:MAG: hypothetical protein IJ274_14235 [Lachnospiraceae bacterium]|nr:hypothetical protein [Lachnospiraceae bacterium]